MLIKFRILNKNALPRFVSGRICHVQEELSIKRRCEVDNLWEDGRELRRRAKVGALGPRDTVKSLIPPVVFVQLDSRLRAVPRVVEQRNLFVQTQQRE